MDPFWFVFTFVAGGVFNALVSVASGEFRAVRDEGRAMERERRKREADDAAAAKQRQREDILDGLDQTVTEVTRYAEWMWRNDHLPRSDRAPVPGTEDLPRSSVRYLADLQLVKDFADVLSFASGLTDASDEDLQAMRQTLGRSTVVLARQRTRVLRDEPIADVADNEWVAYVSGG